MECATATPSDRSLLPPPSRANSIVPWRAAATPLHDRAAQLAPNDNSPAAVSASAAQVSAFRLSPVLVTIGKSELGYSFRGFGTPFSNAPYVKRPDLLPGLSYCTARHHPHAASFTIGTMLPGFGIDNSALCPPAFAFELLPSGCCSALRSFFQLTSVISCFSTAALLKDVHRGPRTTRTKGDL